jgi:hypothetical protein
MSHNAKMLDVDQFDSIDDDADLNIDNTDYGFIVSANGELKTFFCPDNPDGWLPKEVMKIFKIFKITDPSEVIPRSTMLH